MDAMSLAGLGAVGYGTDGSTVVKGIDLGAALLWLLRGKSAWCVPAAGAAIGACCARVPPVSHGGFWKNFLFYVACLAALFALGKLDTSPLPSYLSAYSGVWVLPVEYSVLDFSEDPACTSLGSTVKTCSSRAVEEFTYLLRCGELES